MVAFFRCMPATFYILYTQLGNKFYIGHTTEPIKERLRKHNSNHDGFTGKYRDWVLVYSEEFATKELAYAREREVKAWKSAGMVRRLIASSEHPD
jgi:putative endonuclease